MARRKPKDLELLKSALRSALAGGGKTERGGAEREDDRGRDRRDDPPRRQDKPAKPKGYAEAVTRRP